MTGKIISLGLILALQLSCVSCQESELKLVIELFRHGARRELGVFPDNLKQYPDPNTGQGDLTNTGYREHYLLGRSVREKYAYFLPEVFDHESFQIYESNLNRTIESANSHIFGLFGLNKGGDVEFDEKEFYSPPIKSFDLKLDGNYALPQGVQLPPASLGQKGRNWVFGCDSDCPNLGSKLGPHTADIQNRFNTTFAPLYETLIKNNYDPKKYFGKDYYWIGDAHSICDYFYTKIWNERMDYDPLLKEQCQYLLSFDLFSIFSVKEHRSIYLYNMATIIKEALQQKSEGKNDALKMILLSGHDSNVAAFIDLFRENNYKCLAKEFAERYPSTESFKVDIDQSDCVETLLFTSNIIIELRKDNTTGHHDVHFLYNNDEIGFFDGGSNKTSLEDFVKFLNDLTNINFPEACGVNNEIFDKQDNVLLIAVIVASVLVIILTLLYFYNKKQLVIKKLEYMAENQANEPILQY